MLSHSAINRDVTNTAGAQNGEMQLGFYLCKGNLEVEVICARDVCPEEKEEPGNLESMPFPFAVVNFPCSRFCLQLA